jgi:hypothetical protein
MTISSITFIACAQASVYARHETWMKTSARTHTQSLARTHARTHARTRTRTRTRTHTHTRTHTRTHARTHAHVCVHTHTHAHKYIAHTHTSYVHTRAWKLTYMYSTYSLRLGPDHTRLAMLKDLEAIFGQTPAMYAYVSMYAYICLECMHMYVCIYMYLCMYTYAPRLGSWHRADPWNVCICSMYVSICIYVCIHML